MSIKILVIDDSSTMRSVAESSLRQKGYEVMLADGVQKGLELMKYNKPNFILLDYSLPDIDCGAMCRRLKNEEESKDAPLVVLLSSAETNKTGELEECGADGFIVKPFTAKELVGKVEELMTKKDSGDLPVEPQKESNQVSGKDEVSDDEKIEVDSTLIDSFQKPQPPKKDKFEETSVSLDLDGIHPSSRPIEENVVSPESLSDSSKIETGSDLSHDYDWFVSEIKKEMGENGKEKGKPEPEVMSEESSVDYMTKISLEEKEEPKASAKKQETTGEGEFGRFISEFKEEMEGTPVEKKPKVSPKVEEKPIGKETEITPQEKLSYDKIADQIIDKISGNIAQKIADKIDREFLKQMIKKYLSEK